MKTAINEITGASIVSKSSEAYRENWDRIFENNNKEIIRVFPDYCSTGLWRSRDGSNVDLNTIGIEDKALEIALILWSSNWENVIAADHWKEDCTYVHAPYYEWWYNTGEELVTYMNLKYGNKYQFNYEAYTYELYNS